LGQRKLEFTKVKGLKVFAVLFGWGTKLNWLVAKYFSSTKKKGERVKRLNERFPK